MYTAEATVREYASQHDAIADLPLITRSAEVVEVEKMDRDRRPEVTAAIDRYLSSHDLTTTYGHVASFDDLGTLQDRLAADDHPGLARTVGTLVERYQRPKPMLVRARFRTADPVDFLAGQYVGLRYDGTPRAYSVASSPAEDDIEICVRRVPGGKLSPRLCDDLAVGEAVTVRGPYGELVLQDRSPRDMIFLATGTGVAPFKSMIDYVFETGRDEYEGQKRDIWLFLGTAWKDDLPYGEAFRALGREHDNFHFVPCLSREPVLADWDGETDYVQDALLKHTDPDAVTAPIGVGLERLIRTDPDSGVDDRIDPERVDVYACGINAMVHGLVRTVELLGVPPERIESEGFG